MATPHPALIPQDLPASSRRFPATPARRWPKRPAYEAAGATATEAAAIAERFGEADLFALVVHEQGCVLIKQGRVEDGTALLDEAMVAVVAGELSPIVTGMVYCSVIARCEEAFEVGRAQEWTAALTAWCSEQPDVVAFTGRCLVHRAEIMRRQGVWEDALKEARRAAERQGISAAGIARAFYQQGEIHRQRGDFRAAERAFREASQKGGEPQPGLALLRLAQGNGDAAASAIRRVLVEATDPLKRAPCCRPTSRSCSPSTSSRRPRTLSASSSSGRRTERSPRGPARPRRRGGSARKRGDVDGARLPPSRMPAVA